MDPLQTTLTHRGIVRGRAALLLRSSEIQPLMLDLDHTVCPPPGGVHRIVPSTLRWTGPRHARGDRHRLARDRRRARLLPPQREVGAARRAPWASAGPRREVGGSVLGSLRARRKREVGGAPLPSPAAPRRRARRSPAQPAGPRNPLQRARVF